MAELNPIGGVYDEPRVPPPPPPPPLPPPRQEPPPPPPAPPPAPSNNPWGAGPRPATGRFKDNGAGGLYWDPNDTGPDQPAGGYPPPAPPPSAPGGGYGGTSVFDDPATLQWERLLNARIQALQTPYSNPGFQPAINQLTKYLERLNGPAYTPEQLQTMQTQALDPMERQRSAAKQQVIQRLATRGIGPSSGIVEKALEEVDNQFNIIRAQIQGQFATNAIGLGNQNAATAAGVAPQIANLYQGQFNAQDARAGQAVNLAGQIPQLAWSRLTGAQSLIPQMNPLSLLGGIQSFQNQGYGQSADFSNGLMNLLGLLFGLG